MGYFDPNQQITMANAQQQMPADPQADMRRQMAMGLMKYNPKQESRTGTAAGLNTLANALNMYTGMKMGRPGVGAGTMSAGPNWASQGTGAAIGQDLGSYL